MKIEKGKWYIAPKGRIIEEGVVDAIVFYEGEDRSCGFNHSGVWSENYFTAEYSHFFTGGYVREATPQEVESALIEEAKRRGFDFEKYQYSETLENEVNEIKLWGHYINPPYKYTEVFNNGKWAEVIKNDDKFAELKEAHKNGAVIQSRKQGSSEWCTASTPQWFKTHEYRIKPEEESDDDPYNWVNNSMKEDKPQMFSGGMNKDNKEDEIINTQPHYDNSKGSLYQIAEQRGWNSYQFDICKRIDRALKKGQFKEDLKKTKDLIDLWLREYEN